MTVRLDVYLALERLMLELDEAGDPLADRLRDLMDPLWYGLTDDEHSRLDARTVVGAAQLHPIRCPAGTEVFVVPTDDDRRGPSRTVRDAIVGLTVGGWETAA